LTDGGDCAFLAVGIGLPPVTRLTIRLDFDNGTALGPGKVRLLELIAETGSIRKAAVQMKMSYRRAWMLLQALDDGFGRALITTARGGSKGGGARLTELGEQVVLRYRRLEKAASEAGRADAEALEDHTAQEPAKRPQARRVRRIAQ
jgi:molybdate transport system regulatory protein